MQARDRAVSCTGGNGNVERQESNILEAEVAIVENWFAI